MFYKIFSKQAPGYLLDDFITTQHVETRKVTRSVLNAQIHIPFCRTNKFKYSFFPSSIVAWNDLPLEARIMDSLAKFKKYLNLNLTHLINFLTIIYSLVLVQELLLWPDWVYVH